MTISAKEKKEIMGHIKASSEREAELEHADDWFCSQCNWGPMSDVDDKCKSCGEPVRCDPVALNMGED